MTKDKIVSVQQVIARRQLEMDERIRQLEKKIDALDDLKDVLQYVVDKYGIDITTLGPKAKD